MSTGILVAPQNDATHFLYSVKDPTFFRYNDKWEIYATAYMVSGPAAAALQNPDTNQPAPGRGRGGGGGWSMIHVDFADWKDAPNAKLFCMDTVPGFGGYKCAPEMFYFTPQKKWYYTFQTQNSGLFHERNAGRSEVVEHSCAIFPAGHAVAAFAD